MGFNKDAIADNIAENLLTIKAITLNPAQPFQWSSGWYSPIYCDNRVALSYPALRTTIKNALADLIRLEFPQAEGIAGVATAGIAQGALVADTLELPFAYVRPEPKKHGMGNQIEGRVETGQKVVMVEDLISTGGSSIKAADALRSNGIDVIGTVAIFSYAFDIATANFEAAGIPLRVLSNYEKLIPIALEMGYITQDQISLLSTWRLAPDRWGKSSVC